ncbi:TPA: FAD-binding protein, partial [Candidatus Bipolaricaulota bacterium]|nr:FAD-binding protein [Candidatus Bipolaricaulota bacterium]
LLTHSEVESVEGFVGNFKVRIRKKARYVSEECTGCGECERVCPVRVPSEFDEGLTQRKAIYRPFPQAVPNIYTISRRGFPPCQAACPIHQNAQGYIALVREGKIKEALGVILRDNPLPSVCGRICTHPCTSACTRGEVDEPVNIPGIKRFVLDFAGEYELPRPEPEQERAERVAIVGSGPAGLMCAYELRQRGYRPTIFEALPVAGGMLAVGIPPFRLPREVLKKEIEKIVALGVELKLNTPIGSGGELTLEDLRKEYRAVFIAIGAHKERRLGIPGEDLPGVLGGLEFLKRVNLSLDPDLDPDLDPGLREQVELGLGERVLVVGGGNSAIDVARTALRLGAKEVRIVYRRSREEMPALAEEVEEAEKEGVKFEFLASPKQILGREDRVRVAGLECLRVELGEPDESGRRRPVPLPGSEFVLPCDSVIVTIGQVPDLASLGEKLGLGFGSESGSELELELETTPQGTLAVDPLTLETNVPGVFAGGDCVTGPDAVVTAMAAGRKGAISIDRYLRGRDMHEGREFKLEGPFESKIRVDTEG